MSTNQKKVLVPVADGCEEMEAVITIDVLVRAGASVTVASVNTLTVTCSRGVKIVADKLIQDAAKETYDLIALPVSGELFSWLPFSPGIVEPLDHGALLRFHPFLRPCE
jgi:hypothetical protein